jgi:hypothetical protein
MYAFGNALVHCNVHGHGKPHQYRDTYDHGNRYDHAVTHGYCNPAGLDHDRNPHDQCYRHGDKYGDYYSDRDFNTDGDALGNANPDPVDQRYTYAFSHAYTHADHLRNRDHFCYMYDFTHLDGFTDVNQYGYGESL